MNLDNGATFDLVVFLPCLVLVVALGWSWIRAAFADVD